jgi:hypothetical protein
VAFDMLSGALDESTRPRTRPQSPKRIARLADITNEQQRTAGWCHAAIAAGNADVARDQSHQPHAGAP